MGFFKRVQTAVMKFEKYKIFADEKISKAFIYFFKLIIIFVIVVSFVTAYQVSQTINKAIQFVKTDVPNFSIIEDKLKLETEELIIVTNEEMSLMLLFSPNISESDIDKLFADNKQFQNTLLMAENKIYISLTSASGIVAYEYKTLTQTIGVQEITKQSLLDYFEGQGYTQLIIAIFLLIFAYMLLSYTIITLIDVIILSILGFLTAKLYKVGLNYKQCFNMSIYALTLPILLNILYVIINAFTGFKIEYFQVMYNIISYIYIIAAILIIRSDFNKTASDTIKIEEEVKSKEESIEESIEQPKEEEKNKKEEKDKKEEKNKDVPEPDPGNA